MKKILCLVLVAALVACGVLAVSNGNKVASLTTELDAANAKVAELEASAADTSAADALQTELDAANAKIAELEAAAASAAEDAAAQTEADADLQAQIDLYKPYYDAQVIVEYNGGVIMKDEVMEIYSLYEQSAAQYGMDLAAYGMDTQYKEIAAQDALEDTVTMNKAAELGLDQIDEETLAGLAEEAKTNFESYITAVSPQFEGEDVSAEDVRAKAIAALESMGYSEQIILDALTENYVAEQLYNHITADVTVSDEDIKAAYDALVSEQESSFADDSAYNDARNNGELIVWNPEGYRAVKQVLIRFSDEQDTAYSEIQSTLKSLNSELEAAQAPAEETTEEAAETTEEAAETTEESAETTEEAAETTEESAEEEVRAVEAIEADIAAAEAELEALYAELLPEAQEVIEKFNAGTAFADLIAEHNDDPGMNNEPTATNGYAVAADSTVWDPTFTAGAMSIESVGGISEPLNGSYGIYIIYYESDIPAGPVAYETVSESLAATTLEEKVNQTYNDAVVTWLADAAPVYHLENLAD